MDYLTMPKASTGEFTVLVAIDLHSKFIWAWPLAVSGSAITTIDALEYLRLRFTTPGSLYVDNGSHFVNVNVTNYLDRHGIAIDMASPYTHVGIVESANHLILERLRHLVDLPPEARSTPTDWPAKLQIGVSALNNRVVHHLASYTPTQVLFGLQDGDIPGAPKHIRDREEDRQIMSLEIEEHAKHNNEGDLDTDFQPGDMVMRYDGSLDSTHLAERKLKIKWEGPFVILSIGRRSATLKTVDGTPIRGKCSLGRLKKYRGWTKAYAHHFLCPTVLFITFQPCSPDAGSVALPGWGCARARVSRWSLVPIPLARSLFGRGLVVERETHTHRQPIHVIACSTSGLFYKPRKTL